MSPYERSRDEADRAVRDAKALQSMKDEHSAFFARLAAAPDADSAIEAITARFEVPRETTELAVRQRITALFPPN